MLLKSIIVVCAMVTQTETSETKWLWVETTPVVAEETDQFELSTEYASKFLWHGYEIGTDVFTHKVAGTFGQWDLTAAAVRPDDQDMQRWDLQGGYTMGFEDWTVRLGFDWLLYQELDADDGFDVQSANMTVQHSTGLRYTFAHLWPTNGSSETEAGQMHIVGMDVEAGLVDVFYDVAFNNNFSAFGAEQIKDFSYAAVGLKTGFDTGPAHWTAWYNRQLSLHEQFEDEDIVGVKLSVTF